MKTLSLTFLWIGFACTSVALVSLSIRNLNLAQQNGDLKNEIRAARVESLEAVNDMNTARSELRKANRDLCTVDRLLAYLEQGAELEKARNMMQAMRMPMADEWRKIEDLDPFFAQPIPVLPCERMPFADQVDLFREQERLREEIRLLLQKKTFHQKEQGFQ